MKLFVTTSTALLALAISGMAFAQQTRVTPPPANGASSGATQDKTLLTTPDKAHLPSDLVSGNKPGIETQIQQLENKFEDAVSKHDVAAFTSLLADDFIGTTPEGKVQNKSEWLEETRSDKSSFSATSYAELKVHASADNVAVCTGIAVEAGTHGNGHAFNNRFRFTDLWILRSGKWQCAATQTLLLK